MKKIFVLGSLNTDMVISVPRMPVGGETVAGSGFFTNSGGKGANQAVACGKQHAETYLIGNVGTDAFGEELISALKNYGVCTRFVSKADGSGGVAVIIVENGENRIILDGGANLKITVRQIEDALGFASEGDIFITQLENNIDAVAAGLKLAKSKKMVTVFNPAPAVKLGVDVLSSADYLIVNESECEILTGVFPASEKDVKRAYDELGLPHLKAFIVTLGSRGSVFVEGGKVGSAPARKIEAVDTTAAGDTFVGAFACKIKDGECVESSVNYASLCSALTCTKKGAQIAIPTLEEVIGFARGR